MTQWFNMPNLETIKFLTTEPRNPFVALITKKTRAKELGDFTPVSLIGCIYKVIPKVLMERLKRVIATIVDSQQWLLPKGDK